MQRWKNYFYFARFYIQAIFKLIIHIVWENYQEMGPWGM